MWNKTETRGKVDQAKGKAKQVVATLTRNNALKSQGKVDEVVGNVEVAAGRAVRKATNAAGGLAKAARR